MAVRDEGTRDPPSRQINHCQCGRPHHLGLFKVTAKHVKEFVRYCAPFWTGEATAKRLNFPIKENLKQANAAKHTHKRSEWYPSPILHDVATNLDHIAQKHVCHNCIGGPSQHAVSNLAQHHNIQTESSNLKQPQIKKKNKTQTLWP